MTNGRSSHFPTLAAVSLIFIFTAQSLILAPRLNTRVFDSIPTQWLAPAGWALFILGLFLILPIITDLATNLQSLLYFTAALALALIGYLFYKSDSHIVAVEVFMLGFGLVALKLWPSRMRTLPFSDFLTNLVFLFSTLAVALTIINSLQDPESAFNSPLSTYKLFLAGLFSTAVVLGFIALKNPGTIDRYYHYLIAIPCLLLGIYLAYTTRDVIVQIPPFCAAFGLITKDLIPWHRICLPADEKFGHRLFFFVAGFNLVVLALVSILTRSYAIEGIPISELIEAINISLLLFNIVFFSSCMLIGSINNSISSGEISIAQTNNTKLDEQVEIFTLLQEKGNEIENLTADLKKNERRLTQLNLLCQLEEKLKIVLDPPVAAQLTANSIQHAFNLDLVTIFSYDFPRHEFVSMATAGKAAGTVPPEYRQSVHTGLIGRAARLKKTQYAPDTRIDADFFKLEEQHFLSEAVIPLLHQGLLKGVLVVDSEKVNEFNLLDIETLEAIGSLLLASWNRSNYDERLKGLIRSGITLTTTLETDVAIKEIASTVQQTLAARFVFVTLADQQRVFYRTATAGYAPRLMNYLNQTLGENALVQTIINSSRVQRMHDVRKQDSSINLDNINLRGFLGFPIRMRGQHIGAIMAFGKQGGIYFSEEDESLATLISNQAAASIEATWLYQQLSTAFNTTTRLYDLSNAILKTDKLNDAAAAVAEAALKVGNARIAGIVLFNPQKEIEAQVQIDPDGIQTGQKHPFALIKQALTTDRTVSETRDQISTVCIPLATPHRQYGVLWLIIPEVQWLNQRYSDDLRTLANQAALALERGILLLETQQQREHLQAAYRELETTYDQTLISLSSAVDARDQETEGHCVRVSKLTSHLGRQLGLPNKLLKSLERGALLHDIGKIGIRDNILLKPGPLNNEEWHTMKQHPDLGARMIEGIPFLQDAIPVIRYHQERWDGSGYPIGLKGEEIPLQARVFAVADVFDALTSTRPYRQRVTISEAVKHMRSQADKEFDPRIVEALEELAREGELDQYLTK